MTGILKRVGSGKLPPKGCRLGLRCIAIGGLVHYHPPANPADLLHGLLSLPNVVRCPLLLPFRAFLPKVSRMNNGR